MINLVQIVRWKRPGYKTVGYSIFHITPVSYLLDGHHEGWYKRRYDAVARALELKYNLFGERR